MTFVDYAELVWKRLDSGQTQQAVAKAIGWSRTAVANYAALKAIDADAWGIVTSSKDIVTSDEDDGVTAVVTGVTFTEGLLRNILDLCPAQQVALRKTLEASDAWQAEKQRLRDEANAKRAEAAREQESRGNRYTVKNVEVEPQVEAAPLEAPETEPQPEPTPKPPRKADPAKKAAAIKAERIGVKRASAAEG